MKAPVETVHVFERAGLGAGPFRFLGAVDTAAGVDSMGLRRIGTAADGVTAYTTPGGTCALCGQAIITLVKFQSADGKRFHVGVDCAEKSGEKVAVNKVAKAKRAAKAAVLSTLLADEATRARLARMPHPTAWRAQRGESALDFAEWYRGIAGKAGQAKAAKAILQLLAEHDGEDAPPPYGE